LDAVVRCWEHHKSRLSRPEIGVAAVWQRRSANAQQVAEFFSLDAIAHIITQTLS